MRHSNQNEGIRILAEFVCQAIPNPSLAPPRQAAVAGKEHELAVIFSDFQPLSATLVGQDGRLKDRIEIGSGVTLCPQSQSIHFLHFPQIGEAAVTARAAQSWRICRTSSSGSFWSRWGVNSCNRNASAA